MTEGPTQNDIFTDADLCLATGGQEGDLRVCMFEKGHEGIHGWEISAEASAMANEIQIETGCAEEVAESVARYAFQQIDGWKKVAENAWLQTELARSVAVDLHEVLVEIVAEVAIDPEGSDLYVAIEKGKTLLEEAE